MSNVKMIEEYQELFDLFNTISAVVYSYDLQSKIICVPQSVADIFGCAKEQFDQKYWKKVIHPEDRGEVLKWQKQMLTGRESSCMRYRIIRNENEVRWIEDHLSPVFDLFGEVKEYMGIIIDITEQKKVEQKIEYLAFHDTLTGLPNRNIFNEYFQKALARCKRKGMEMAVLFIDLDRFKLINDTLGHEIGDVILKHVSERLTRCVRDFDIVSRQGGDEFIILLEDTDMEKSEHAAQRILTNLRAPFLVKNEEIFITASIGISLYPLHGDDIDTLIRSADEAMYVAKDHGNNLYYFYHTDMQNKQIRKMRLEQALRKAIENNEMAIYYQPLIDFYSGDIIGMEALLRWMHPALGLILPLEFIPIAEESGQIDQIGEWVLQQACAQNKRWQDSGFVPFKIVVNVSNYQFKNPNFLNVVKGVIYKTGLSPCWLELDITEGFIQNINEAIPITRELADLGIKISVDNFGTGVFSFDVFNRLPIEYLKIGRNLIHDLADPNTLVLVKAIIQMGKSLNLKLLAEGIENEDHIEFLKANNCYFGQGDYYSPPIPAEEADKLLESFFEWKSRYGGHIKDANKIIKIEEENKKLKQMLAELALKDKQF